MRRRRVPITIALLLFVAGYALVVLLPIAWGVLVSLKTRADALSMPPKWLFSPTLANYRAAFVEGRYVRPLLNSLFIASASSLFAALLGVPMAYAVSRRRFAGARAALLGVMTVRMAPATVIALPLFLIFTQLRLIDSYAAIILVHTAVGLALVVWIMKTFFDEVPTAIDEASLLDGDTRLTALLRQVLPVCAPGLLVTVFFCFVNSWNEFFLALMLTGFESRPFTVAIPALVTPHGTYWGEVTAVSTVGFLPGLVFAVFARRHLVRELMAGAIWR